MRPDEQARLDSQTDRILARLEAGPVANTELAAISLKYTSRVSDLRARGLVVECYDRDHATGVCWYRLAPIRRGFDSIPRVEIPVPKGSLF